MADSQYIVINNFRLPMYSAVTKPKDYMISEQSYNESLILVMPANTSNLKFEGLCDIEIGDLNYQFFYKGRKVYEIFSSDGRVRKLIFAVNTLGVFEIFLCV